MSPLGGEHVKLQQELWAGHGYNNNNKKLQSYIGFTQSKIANPTSSMIDFLSLSVCLSFKIPKLPHFSLSLCLELALLQNDWMEFYYFIINFLLPSYFNPPFLDWCINENISLMLILYSLFNAFSRFWWTSLIPWWLVEFYCFLKQKY